MPALSLEDNETLEIRDTAAAEIFLESMGMIETFPTRPDSNPWMGVAVNLIHPTHAIVGTYVSGFPDRKDEGYTLIAFPKSKFSPNDVRVFVDLLKKNGEVHVAGWDSQTRW